MLHKRFIFEEMGKMIKQRFSKNQILGGIKYDFTLRDQFKTCKRAIPSQ